MVESESTASKVKQAKFKMFFDYINYDWSKNSSFQSSVKKETFATKQDAEHFKRRFYHEHVNPAMELYFFLAPEEHAAFIEFARF